MELLEEIYSRTLNYISRMPKEERKQYGQFFTDSKTAKYMSSLFNFNCKKDISVLDPGSGSGILSCAFILEAISCGIRNINLVCYENDQKVIPLLKDNLELIKNSIEITFNYEIREVNYILSQKDDFAFQASTNKFDFIIGNPPYKKISKENIEAKAMESVCFGTPNLYFLFASMSIFNLKKDGEMVYIIPRSWTSGQYFKNFRKFLFSNSCLEKVHLFISRDKVFDSESILQETMIIKISKKVQKENVEINSSSASDFSEIERLNIDFRNIIFGEDMYLLLPTTKKDVGVLTSISSFKNKLPLIGFKMKTGIVVDFRTPEVIFDHPIDGSFPLMFSKHLTKPFVSFPKHDGCEYIFTDKKSMLQECKNYLFLKRFTSKEEKRRLQPSMFFASKFQQYAYISSDNKVNFIESTEGEMTDDELRGLFVVFNSKLFDSFYRILNGSTQVNSSEINSMLFPSRNEISQMGKLLDEKTLDKCDSIMEEILCLN